MCLGNVGVNCKEAPALRCLRSSKGDTTKCCEEKRQGKGTDWQIPLSLECSGKAETWRHSHVIYWGQEQGHVPKPLSSSYINLPSVRQASFSVSSAGLFWKDGCCMVIVQCWIFYLVTFYLVIYLDDVALRYMFLLFYLRIETHTRAYMKVNSLLNLPSPS